MSSANIQSGLMLTLVEAVGDFQLRQYAKEDPAFWRAGVGVAVYVGLAGLLTWSLQNPDTKLGLVNTSWDATSTLLTAGVGVMAGETYTPRQWAGIGLCAVGIWLIDG